MKPKEKAKKIALSFIDLVHTEEAGLKKNVKRCALICADEVLEALSEVETEDKTVKDMEEFWYYTRKEIKKL